MAKHALWLLSGIILLNSSAQPVDPQADIAEQVPAAIKILKAWEGEAPAEPSRFLHIVYWTPADREPGGSSALDHP